MNRDADAVVDGGGEEECQVGGGRTGLPRQTGVEVGLDAHGRHALFRHVGRHPQGRGHDPGDDAGRARIAAGEHHAQAVGRQFHRDGIDAEPVPELGGQRHERPRGGRAARGEACAPDRGVDPLATSQSGEQSLERGQVVVRAH